MLNSFFNRVIFLSSLITFLGVLAFSTIAQAQYSSSGTIIPSQGSGSYKNHNSGFNTQHRDYDYGNTHNGLRLKTHGYKDAHRSGVRLGNSGYYQRDYLTRTLERNNQAILHHIGNNDNRRIRRVQNRRYEKNEGYSYGTNPRYNRNVRRTNQFNSNSDLYYVDQYGYDLVSTNNRIPGQYNNDDFDQIVVINGSGEQPACPKGHDCGYRLYEDGTGPRIITLGESIEGLPPQDGLTGGPKVITLGK